MFPATPLLAVESLSLERGGRELFRGLSFEVHAGHLFQVEGANGAGKTSLLRILCGLSRYGFSGKVSRHAPLLYLGHHSGVKGLLTPRENLALHVSGQGSHSDRQIEAALAQVGLYGYEDVPRLYLSDCPLWLLDEPFTAIDKTGIGELESLLVRHVEHGGAVVMTSHQTLQVSYEVRFLSLLEGVVL